MHCQQRASNSSAAAEFPWIQIPPSRSSAVPSQFNVTSPVQVTQSFHFQPSPSAHPRTPLRLSLPTVNEHEPSHDNSGTTPSTANGAVAAANNAISFYHPMNCRSSDEPQSQQEAHALLLKGFSPNYRGDPDLLRNQSAAISAEGNCSLFLVGLAPDLTTHELLSGIRGVGRVYATHINPPVPERGHVYSAAKLVFFERQGAEFFYDLYSTTGYATPRNPHLRARVTWNRVRSAEIDKEGRRSRVLLVSGPPAIVSRAFLGAYLDTKMVYQLDEVVHHGASDDGGRVLLEFRFGSFRCQAEAARMALMREFREAGVVCEYGCDPCDAVQGP
ncbi:hypothetical protein C8A00DRAFT_32193 [Chaetomidium leptoderma]|uniref:Uncharacterized protein n=1 Tax=Chaetomidium leptoderma TaxID=669021 RepID=A0AAN6VPQ9_9PEZI|nr:hypothetical protein C8A00DRAFT_32193 [Chaetomidium leptoderma]